MVTVGGCDCQDSLCTDITLEHGGVSAYLQKDRYTGTLVHRFGAFRAGLDYNEEVHRSTDRGEPAISSLVENMVKKNRSRFSTTVLLTTIWSCLHQT